MRACGDVRLSSALADNCVAAGCQVALLFLTRAWLPYEPVWQAFLSSVPSLDHSAAGAELRLRCPSLQRAHCSTCLVPYLALL
jgi:hypothetical protein